MGDLDKVWTWVQDLEPQRHGSASAVVINENCFLASVEGEERKRFALCWNRIKSWRAAMGVTRFSLVRVAPQEHDSKVETRTRWWCNEASVDFEGSVMVDGLGKVLLEDFEARRSSVNLDTYRFQIRSSSGSLIFVEVSQLDKIPFFLAIAGGRRWGGVVIENAASRAASQESAHLSSSEGLEEYAKPLKMRGSFPAGFATVDKVRAITGDEQTEKGLFCSGELDDTTIGVVNGECPVNRLGVAVVDTGEVGSAWVKLTNEFWYIGHMGVGESRGVLCSAFSNHVCSIVHIALCSMQQKKVVAYSLVGKGERMQHCHSAMWSDVMSDEMLAKVFEYEHPYDVLEWELTPVDKHWYRVAKMWNKKYLAKWAGYTNV